MNQGIIGELWRYRELLYFFTLRDLKIRYRQAALGAAWAVIQPLANMVIFSLLFGRVAHIPTGPVPYPVFILCGLLPWTYVSGVLIFASVSLVNNDPLLTKVYFPRAFLPFASVVAGLLDFLIGLALLAILMLYYHIRVGWMLLLSPAVAVMMVLLTAGLGMIASALSVRYRDVRYALPFLVQVWMFVTPVVYPPSVIPQRFHQVLALNPCWGIVDGMRAALLGLPFDARLLGISFATAITVFLVGAYYFRQEERNFADVI